MKFPIAILVAGHVLLHAVLGCCWHPVHGKGRVGGPHLAGEGTCHQHGHDEHDHGCGHDALPGDQGPGEQHVCSHDQCKWIIESTATNIELLAASQNAVCIDDACFTLMVLNPALRLDRIDHDRPATLPVRSHLAVAILLI